MSASNIITILILLFFSAIFSLMEITFISISNIQVEAFLKQKRLGARTLQKLKRKPRRVIISILMSNTLVNFTAVALAVEILSRVYPLQGAFIATIIMTILVLTFGQILPKIIGEQYSRKIVLFLAKPIHIIVFILTPFAFIFEYLSRKIPFTDKAKRAMTSEEFEAMLKVSQKGGIVTKQSSDLIRNLIEFQSVSVREILTPYEHVSVLDGEKKISENIKEILKSKHSQYPVYLKLEDNIKGMIKTIDVLEKYSKKRPNTKTKTIMQKAFIVPDSKNVEDLLMEMNEKEHEVAIVVDEFGKFAGITTYDYILSNVIRIVATGKHKKIPRSITVLGDTMLEDISSIFNIKLKSKAHKTISGLIEEKLERIPKKSEKITVAPLVIEILSSTKKLIKKVKIKLDD